MKIFISYSHKDKKFVHKLKEKLGSNNFDVFVDEHSINPGANIVSKIDEAISNSDVVLAIISEAYTNSKWTSFEYTIANNLIKRLIPILIEDCELPIGIRNIQYLDYRQRTTSSYDKLVESLHHIALQNGIEK